LRRITVLNHVTLDGVMQAPGRPDEDVRGGFAHGGWATAAQDEVMGRFLGRRMAAGSGALLLGRQTYTDFANVWPQRPESPYSAVLDNAQKYVVSTTLSEPLPWRNSTLLKGVDDVAALKREPGPDLGVMGSGRLIRTLARESLIDEYILMIYPLVLGSGLRLFSEEQPEAALRLRDSVTTSTGVIIATYSVGDADSGPTA
jgi:dihydrofolate reductase